MKLSCAVLRNVTPKRSLSESGTGTKYLWVILRRSFAVEAT